MGPDTGPVPKGVSMTDDELRIIAFLEASGATRPAEFPDGMLALLEGDRPEEMGPELIAAASLLYARRLRPGIGLDAARAFMAEYAADPARLADLSERFAAFRLACAFERLKRAGRLEDVFIDDPFDPEAEVSVRLTEARMAGRQPGVAPPGRPDRPELAGRPAGPEPWPYIRGPAQFGVRCWPLWGSVLATLGFGAGQFGVRGRAVWGPGPGSLGSGAGQFGVRPCSVWGPALRSLGSGPAQFGVRPCSVWGPALLSLGSGPAQFGVRIPRRNFFQMPGTKPFMRPQPLARL